MTKRILWSAFLLVLCLAFCISSYRVVEKSINETVEELTILSELLQNESEESIKTAEQCEEKWKITQERLNMFLDHSLLETISEEIPSIAFLAKRGYYDLASESTLKSINALKQILNEQELIIGNIL